MNLNKYAGLTDDPDRRKNNTVIRRLSDTNAVSVMILLEYNTYHS